MLIDRLTVLFLCTGNSCRSQMAEGWAKALKKDSLCAYSAGIEPHGLNTFAVSVMAEVGVDISSQESTHVDQFMHLKFDWVVTVCEHADRHCPVFPGSSRVIHQPFDDPPKLAKTAKNDTEIYNCYRRVRDEIREYINTMPDSLKI